MRESHGEGVAIRTDPESCGAAREGGVEALTMNEHGKSDRPVVPEKTRLLEFGRFAAGNRTKRGQGKPETFEFLGFTHICGKTRNTGRFTVLRQTARKRLHAKLKRGESRAQATNARFHPRVGQVAGLGGWWTLPVLRGAHEQRSPGSVPAPCRPTLASRTIQA